MITQLSKVVPLMRFLPLLLTVFIDSLGFGLVFPIFSPLVMNETGGMFPAEASLAFRGLIFGFLISSFCIGQFFGGPILGAISDRRGRKKVLLATLWLALVSYLLSAFSIWMESIILLFVCRMLSGVAAGNFAVAQSIIADLSTTEQKGKNFGLLGMAWGVGFIIGPYLGGKLSDPSFASFAHWTTPFLFAALLCLVNIFLLLFRLQESLPEAQIRKVNLLSGFADLKKGYKHPTLRGIFMVMFLFSFGWGFFTEFSPLFLIRRFHFDQGQIGNFYAMVGLWIALCQGLLIRPFVKKFAPHRLLLGALLIMGFLLPSMLLIKTGTAFYLFLPFLAFSESLIYPTASTMVSNLSSKESQGEMLGIHHSIQWAAIGISPLFSGSLVALYPHLPLTVAGCSMFLAFSVLCWILKTKRLQTS